tara:strand:+ start:920 stop:1405 length:486 start_codon:yes stop_codon:yes gene_type:complete
MKYKIIDNFLEKNQFLQLQNLICSDSFAWYLVNGVNNIGDGSYQLVHSIYKSYKVNSIFFDNLKPIIDKLKPKALIRIKANFIAKTNKIIEHGYHTDFTYPNSKTAVYYINSNNGYTKFKKGGFVSESKENKIIIFKSNELHTGSSCTDSQYRIVLNINYF